MGVKWNEELLMLSKNLLEKEFWAFCMIHLYFSWLLHIKIPTINFIKWK